MKKIKGKIILEDSIINGQIQFEDHYILSIEECSVESNAPYIFPGFIDIHTHGCNGFDVMSGKSEHVLEMSKLKASQGVCLFLPTTLTAQKPRLLQVLAAIKEAYDIQVQNENNITGAKIFGIHFEGPYITKSKYRGAQNPEYTYNPSIEDFIDYYTISGNLIKLVTMAPELSGSLQLIKKLVDLKIRVSVGHSEANSEQLQKGIESGITSATHMFNGMKEFNHYNLGCVGTVLINDDMYCEVIGDTKHVIIGALEIIFRCKPKNKIMFITDSNYCSGLPDGNYLLDEIPIIVKNNEARTTVGGMAGSLVRMDEVLKNLVNNFYEKTNRTKLSLPQISNMLSKNQAEFLNLYNCGIIKKNNIANFTLVNSSFEVVQTIIQGKTVYKV